MNAADVDHEVGGWADERYAQAVREFSAGVHEPERTGAAYAMYREGKEVLNIWKGVADARSGRPYDGDTPQVIFSASKGLSVLVLARLHEQRAVDLNSPIRDVWPEFAAHGKGHLAIADVLAHRAGVSALPDDLTLEEAIDSRVFAERVAAAPPLWTPGTGHAYHALTFGAIAQELVRRVAGRELYELFSEEIAGPLGADATMRAGTEDLARVAPLLTGPEWTLPPLELSSPIMRALTLGDAFSSGLVGDGIGMNDPRVITAGLAAVGGVATARALARIWSAVVVETDGVRLLSDDTIALLIGERSTGPWQFPLPGPYGRWGIGVQLSSELTPWYGSQSFGHDGAGGQSGMADAELKIGVGYTRNRMSLIDPTLPLVPLTR